MIRRILILFATAFLFAPGVFPQPVKISDFNYLMYNRQYVRELNLNEVAGHPYSDPELLPGSVYFVSGGHVDSIPMRYNWYSGVMEFRPEEELLAMPESENIAAVVIGQVRYIPFFNQKPIKGYLVELCRGKYNLFKEERVAFFDPIPAQSGYDKPQPAKFEWSKPSYLVITDDGNLFRLEQNRKQFLRQFPENDQRLTAFLDENRINLKKEEDLIGLFGIMNSWDEQEMPVNQTAP